MRSPDLMSWVIYTVFMGTTWFVTRKADERNDKKGKR